MKLSHVLFLGGRNSLASVQVRCIDMANRLGCDFLLNVQAISKIPEKYSVFVCVKPDLHPRELKKLADRGTVVWDIIDHPPPREHVSVYLTSNKMARHFFSGIGRIVVIPHHHCNFDAVPNPPNLRQPAWIGSPQWRPKLTGFRYDTYSTSNMKQAEVVLAHRQMGIGLNFRGRHAAFHLAGVSLNESETTAVERRRLERNFHNFHLVVNSGIKLINCIGFGTPSISGDEPAYHEIGEDCTIFSNIKDSAKWVRALQNDDDLYMDLRKKCLRKAGKFHIDVIAQKYRALFATL